MAARVPRRFVLRLGAPCPSLVPRQIDAERRPRSERAVDVDEPHVLLDDPVERCQAQPRALALALRREERLEEP